MITLLGASAKTGAFFGPGNGPIYKVLHVNCSDTEYNFSNCVTYEREDEHNSHSEDVGVKCQTSKENCSVIIVCRKNYVDLVKLYLHMNNNFEYNC